MQLISNSVGNEVSVNIERIEFTIRGNGCLQNDPLRYTVPPKGGRRREFHLKMEIETWCLTLSQVNNRILQ